MKQYLDEKELPTKVRIEASSVCQLNCRVCYMRKNPELVKNGCGSGFLSFENFKKFVDINKNIKEIELSNNGEIFLNPDLIKILEYAYEKEIALTAANGVNLNKLTDTQAEALVKYEFNTMTISIDGASPKTYSEYRCNGDFNKVIQNIKKINFYKEKYKKNSPYLVWKFIVFGHNEHEIKKVKKLAPKIGVNELTFDVSYDKNYSLIKNKKYVIKETGIEHLDINMEPIVQLKEFNTRNIDWYFCNFLWEAPQINWDGQILGCCENYSSNFGKTDFTDKLIDILNNPKIIYAKKMLTGEAPAIDGIPCTNCRIYKAMKEAEIYIESSVL